MGQKISVIIPVYNMENLLPQCLDSVFSQTIKDIEIICIDDGSVDHSSHILNNYKNDHSNMYIIKQHHQGVAAARNTGIKEAKGEYIFFLDSDDYLANDIALEILYNGAKKTSSLAACGSIIKEVEGRKYSSIANHENCTVMDRNGLFSYRDLQIMSGFSRFIYNRKMILDNNILFPSYVRAEDISFMVKALDCADNIFCCTNYVYVYRHFDKRISIESMRVCNDVARGYRDISVICIKKNYQLLAKRCINGLNLWTPYFLLHIKNGNYELVKILNQIKDNFDKTTYDFSNEFLPTDQTDIDDFINNQILYSRNFIDEIKKYKKVIIYGAGHLGGVIYDFIKPIQSFDLLEFVVSNPTPIGTARDNPIHCIRDYIELKNDVLVIVAVRGKENQAMIQYAKELGFIHIMLIDKELIDYDHFSIIP